jgi:UDP-N-acetylglucosamine 2-epimerase (non-hydrolysing)
LKIALVVGARPNFMKIAPLALALREYPSIDVRLVHTQQHYDESLSAIFFDSLPLPVPDAVLGVGSGELDHQVATCLTRFAEYLRVEHVDAVVVPGDVNSTLACGLAAAQMNIPIVHVEAGLRSFDRSMPEELNRRVVDHLSDVLLTHSSDADSNLISEGLGNRQIHQVGNLMIDSLVRVIPQLDPGYAVRHFPAPTEYVLVTLHRPSNVDDVANVDRIIEQLSSLPLPVLFVTHPRAERILSKVDAANRLANNHGQLLAPLGYIEFLSLQVGAAAVVTDSGGVQEETTYLGVPCLTFRKNTERPITLTQGTNRLIGTDPLSIAPALLALPSRRRIGDAAPERWDGHAGIRAAEVIANCLT